MIQQKIKERENKDGEPRSQHLGLAGVSTRPLGQSQGKLYFGGTTDHIFIGCSIPLHVIACVKSNNYRKQQTHF
jgi:hypothetical protein